MQIIQDVHLPASVRLPTFSPASAWVEANKRFLLIVAALFSISFIFYQQPQIAMWIGFGIAGYSAIADDSIQTIGTFLSSNRQRRWWILWLYIGGILVVVLFWGWLSGDVAHGRLDRIPPTENFRYLQLSAPIILLIMTRLAMPVSTTFLLLSTFSETKTIEGMVKKSLLGYGVAFIFAILLWTILSSYMNRRRVQNPAQAKTEDANEKYWYTFQWISTGALWAVWLMQDAANVVVFLPRALSLTQIVVVIAFLFGILAIIFRAGGGNIQRVVESKTDVQNVRSASIIDFFYAIILFIFKGISNLPMSTTWVFLGLLAGREFAIAHSKATATRQPNESRYQKAAALMGKDLVRATFGMAVSVGLALAIRL